MYAITGITGQIGGVIGRALLSAKMPVRAVVRDAEKGKAWATRGCEIALATIEDSSSLAAAFDGVEAVFVLVPPNFDPQPGFPEAQVIGAALRSALKTARPARVVYLSTIGAQARRPNLLTQHTIIEQALSDLPVSITFLRPAWFMENCRWDVAPAREHGVIPSFLQPLDKPVPMVATTDIGKRAATLLQEHWNGHRVVELEGPHRVTPNEIAAAFAKVLSRSVQMQSVLRNSWEELFRSQGMKNPLPRIQMLDGFNEGWIEFEKGEAVRKKEAQTWKPFSDLSSRQAQSDATAFNSTSDYECIQYEDKRPQVSRFTPTEIAMSFESLLAESRRLSVSVEALAALGAQLRLQELGLDCDLRVRALLNEVVRAVDPQLLENVDAQQRQAVLALIQTIFRQALDLLENPGRAPGWNYTDENVLQSQGQLSRLVVKGIDVMAAQRPSLGKALQRPGAFLDVGTGSGWLAIEAARSWPALRVVGVDPWEPALALARKNLAQREVAKRVELRAQPVELLQDKAAFTVAWLPGPFIAAEIAERVLERVHNALVPGGWLIFGFNPPLSTPLAEAVANLRIVRSGGHPWTSKEVEEKLRATGFEQIEAYSPAPPILFVAGRRAEKS